MKSRWLTVAFFALAMSMSFVLSSRRQTGFILNARDPQKATFFESDWWGFTGTKRYEMRWVEDLGDDRHRSSWNIKYNGSWRLAHEVLPPYPFSE